MEKLKLTDLYTSEPVRFSYSSPTLLLFFSLKDIFLLKELAKDLSHSLLKGTGIYIGDESKKVHLWRQKEPDSIESFNGGSSIKSYSDLQVLEVPWIVIISNNSLFLSKKLSEFEKPVIKSLLHKHPEFKKPKEKKQETLEEIISSKKLTTDEKISLLENLSNESQGEIVGLRKELEEKDRTIRDIMHKLDIFLGNKNKRKRKGVPVVEEVKAGRVDEEENYSKEQDDDHAFHQDLWIYSIRKLNEPLPAINPRSKQTPANLRSKSTGLNAKVN